MVRNIILGLLAFKLLALLAYGGYQAFNSSKPPKLLAYYGPVGKDSVQKDSISTSFYQIPNFVFIDQDSQKISRNNLQGKIFVADFFFTTCQGICPAMTRQMDRLAHIYQADTNLWFLSHTVNPEYDTVGVLRAYAQSKGINNKRWRFLTGPKKDLYKMAREGYFIDYNQGKARNESFVHTENFVLVDKNGNIRGYYDGTDSLSINDLIKDINLLKAQFDYEQAGKSKSFW